MRLIDTDLFARGVVEPGQPALEAVVSAFGADILDAEGRLDRRRMRERIFSDPAAKHRLEAILHPAIRAEMERQSREAGGPYQVLVIPLLVEGERACLFDRVLVVDCPEELQVERLMSRDGETREGALGMLAAQATRQERLAAADDVIVNEGPAAGLERQVAGLDRKYREMAAKN